MLENKYLILKNLKRYLIKNKVLYPKNPKDNKLTLRFLTIYGYTWTFQIELLGKNCIYPIFTYDRNNNNFEDFMEIANFLGFDLKNLEDVCNKKYSALYNCRFCKNLSKKVDKSTYSSRTIPYCRIKEKFIEDIEKEICNGYECLKIIN